MQKSRKSVRRLVDSAIIIGTALFVEIIHWLDTGEGGLHIDGMIKVALVYGSVILCRFIFGIYVSLWRYANIYSYLKLIFADMLAGFVFFSLGMFRPEWSLGISYTMVMFLTIMLVSLMSRFFYQILRSNSLRYGEEEKTKVESGSKKELNKINVAIVGAGE